MSWQPSPDSLRQLAAYLKDSMGANDMTVQKQAELMLSQATHSPDIYNYLAFLFSTADVPGGLSYNAQDYLFVRSAAGIMIKNNVRGKKSIPDDSMQFIRMAALMGLHDKASPIRNFAGNIATEIIRKSGLISWPDLLPELLKLIGNESGQTSEEAQEGAMSAMAKICEDNAKMLTKEINGQRPLNYVLPQLIAATKSSLPRVRTSALTAINVFTPKKSQAMMNCVDDLLQHLFILSSDDSRDVRRQVCRAFVNLVETRPDKLQPHIAGLVDYIITQQKSSDDEDLACEAAEFWLAAGEHRDLWQSLQPHLNKIIPVLLECMVYSGEDIALLEGQSDDEDEEDRAEDIKPNFAKKTATRNVNSEANASADGKDGNGYEKLGGMDDDLEDGEIEEFDDGDDANPDERWTLRKCSAAALDVFACDFKGPVFEAILPYLSQNIKHSEWPNREAAVLALGAVAEGCMPSVIPHLPDLVPYLISLLEDEEAVVRQITCWTLGRYSAWAAKLQDPAERERFFVPMMDGILRKMLDKNKKVQQAGASAFANLEENAGSALEPYCGPIVQQFVRCFAKYKDRSMYVLYDCVQTLADRLGSFIAHPELATQLMSALNDRYQKVSDESRELFPLLECLSYVAIALGDAFAPYGPTIFSRCVNIVHTNLEQSLAAANNSALDPPDKDFLITSLDLLSAIIQALDDDKAAELMRTTQQPFFELLTLCMEDPTDEVRQSAYALLGDCSRFVYPQLQSYLGRIMPILMKQLELDNILDEDFDNGLGVVNNACWSCGEISLQAGKNMAAYIPDLLHRFVDILSNPRVPNGLSENAAIALGRLGIDNADVLAPALGTFAEEFLTNMAEVEPSDENASALKGFAMIVGQNPQAMERVLLQLFMVMARYDESKLQSPIKEELHQVFQNVLNVYKQMMPQFNDFLRQMGPEDQQLLSTKYAV